MNTRFLVASILLCGACRVDAKVKASSDTNETSPERSDGEPSFAAEPAAVEAGAPVATASPADACPLSCYAARGGEKANLTTEEVAQLRTSLEPVLGRMRTCTTPEDWRRHGSPFINLRIAPDGTLSELGVDPHHGSESACFDDAGRNAASVSVTLPGRKVVRCAERCEHERLSRGRRGRGRRAR